MKVGNLTADLNLNAKGFTAGINNAKGNVAGFGSKLKAITPSVTAFSLKITALGAAFFFATRSIAKSLAQVEAIQRRMRFVTKTAEGNARAWSFLDKTSRRLGIGLETLAGSYSNLAAAARSSNITAEDLESIFTAVSESASILGLDAQRTRFAFMAIEQMASKGVVAMEELRRQLSEHIPGATGLMARALGVTTQELNKLVKTGRLASEYVLPLLADQMRGENKQAVEELGESFQRSIGNAETAWFKLKEAFVDATIIKDTIDLFSFSLKQLDNLWTGLKQIETNGMMFMGDYVSGAKTVNEEISRLSDERKEELRNLALGGATGENESAFGLKALQEWQNTVVSVFQNVGNEFTSFVTGLATGMDVTFMGMLNNMARHILNFTTQIMVVKPILEWFRAFITGVSAPGANTGGLLGGLLSAINMPLVPDKAMASGGIINEPVVGVGVNSKSSYLLGENGPETVTPMGQGSGQGTNINITVNALDSKSLTELMRDNPQAVTGPIVDAISSGDRGLSQSLRMAVL